MTRTKKRGKLTYFWQKESTPTQEGSNTSTKGLPYLKGQCILGISNKEATDPRGIAIETDTHFKTTIYIH